MVGFHYADVDAARTGSAAGHDYGATTVSISLVPLRNFHLESLATSSEGGYWPVEVGRGWKKYGIEYGAAELVEHSNATT
jgi:hypothetical protein